METRPVRHLHQCRSLDVSPGHLDIHIFSHHSHCKLHYDELERAYVLWHYYFCRSALHDLGKTRLCWTSGIDKEGSEVS